MTLEEALNKITEGTVIKLQVMNDKELFKDYVFVNKLESSDIIYKFYTKNISFITTTVVENNHIRIIALHILVIDKGKE